MPIQVKCSCGKTLNAPDSLAGKAARCPACKGVIKIPAADASAAQPAAQKAPAKTAAAPAPKPQPAPPKEPEPQPEPENDAADYDDYDDYDDQDDQTPVNEPVKSEESAQQDADDYDDFDDDDEEAQDDSDDEAESDNEDSSTGVVTASIGKRIVAFVIDGVLISVICGVLTFAIVGSTLMNIMNSGAKPDTAKIVEEGVKEALAADTVGADIAAAKVKEEEGSSETSLTTDDAEVAAVTPETTAPAGGVKQQDMQADILAAVMGIWFVLLIPFAYGLLFEGLAAATPGKFAMGMRVLDDQGHPCGFVKSLIRNIIKAILGVISMIVALFTQQRKAVHDMAAGTLVATKSSMKVLGASHARVKSGGRKDSVRKSKSGDDDSEASSEKPESSGSARKSARVGKKVGKKISKRMGKKVGKKVGKKIGKKVGKKISKKMMRK